MHMDYGKFVSAMAEAEAHVRDSGDIELSLSKHGLPTVGACEEAVRLSLRKTAGDATVSQEAVLGALNSAWEQVQALQSA